MTTTILLALIAGCSIYLAWWFYDMLKWLLSRKKK